MSVAMSSYVTLNLSFKYISNAINSSLVELCAARRAALQRARDLFQFVQDDEEERAWLAEKQQVRMGNMGMVKRGTGGFRDDER